MLLKEEVSKSYQLRQEIKAVDEKIEDLKKQKEELESQLDLVDSGLLAEIKTLGKQEEEFDGLFLNYFKKNTVAYTSDSDVLKYLKDNGFISLFKTKVTEVLDKNAIKKELKTNTVLKEALAQYIVDKVTEYVTVTDAENHKKMLEHIEEGSKK
jgi:hypothetical protein